MRSKDNNNIKNLVRYVVSSQLKKKNNVYGHVNSTLQK